jgi:hypothetical protein
MLTCRKKDQAGLTVIEVGREQQLNAQSSKCKNVRNNWLMLSKLKSSAKDRPYTRVLFLYSNVVFMLSILTTAITHSSNNTVFTFAFCCFYVWLNWVALFGFRQNRKIILINIKFLVILIFVWISIFVLSVQLTNSLSHTTILILAYSICNFLTLKLHESTMTQKGDTSQMGILR